MENERIGVYPGTFDPITKGHLHIIRRASRLVDRLSPGIKIHDASMSESCAGENRSKNSGGLIFK